eukprot:m.237026 g.237026  ORF g.237026 m.237026 type:complete len:1251 (-) comp26554_c0_seq6:96-3848(-)
MWKLFGKKKGKGHDGIEAAPVFDKEETIELRKSWQNCLPTHPCCLAYDHGQHLLAIAGRYGEMLILGDAGIVRRWCMEPCDGVSHLHFIPNEPLLLAVCPPRGLQLWHYGEETCQIAVTYKFKHEQITATFLSPDSSFLFIGTSKGDIFVLDQKSLTRSTKEYRWNLFTPRGQSKKYPGHVKSVQEHPFEVGKLLTCHCTQDKLGPTISRVSVLNLMTDELEAQIVTRGEQAILTAAWMGKSSSVACGHTDGNITVWDAKEKNPSEPEFIGGDHSSGLGNPVTKLLLCTEGQGSLIVDNGGPVTSIGHVLRVQYNGSQRLVEFERDIADYLCVTKSPWIQEVQSSRALLVLSGAALHVLNLAPEVFAAAKLMKKERTVGLPKLFCPHGLNITEQVMCTVNVQCDREFIAQLKATGHSYSAGDSNGAWPIRGGEHVPSHDATPHENLVLTGHADGSVRFWHNVGACLRLLYTLPPPSLRQCAEFFPADGHNVKCLQLCLKSKTLAIAYFCGSVFVYSFSSKKCSAKFLMENVKLEIPSSLRDGEVEKHARRSPHHGRRLSPSPHPPLSVMGRSSSTEVKTVEDEEDAPKKLTVFSKQYSLTGEDVLSQKEEDVNPAHLDILIGYGFPEEQCRAALLSCDNDVAAASEKLYDSHEFPASPRTTSPPVVSPLSRSPKNSRPVALKISGLPTEDSETDAVTPKITKQQSLEEPLRSRGPLKSQSSNTSLTVPNTPRSSVSNSAPPTPQSWHSYPAEPGFQLRHCLRCVSAKKIGATEADLLRYETVDSVTCLDFCAEWQLIAFGNVYGVCLVPLAQSTDESDEVPVSPQSKASPSIPKLRTEASSTQVLSKARSMSLAALRALRKSKFKETSIPVEELVPSDSIVKDLCLTDLGPDREAPALVIGTSAGELYTLPIAKDSFLKPACPFYAKDAAIVHVSVLSEAGTHIHLPDAPWVPSRTSSCSSLFSGSTVEPESPRTHPPERPPFRTSALSLLCCMQTRAAIPAEPSATPTPGHSVLLLVVNAEEVRLVRLPSKESNKKAFPRGFKPVSAQGIVLAARPGIVVIGEGGEVEVYDANLRNIFSSTLGLAKDLSRFQQNRIVRSVSVSPLGHIVRSDQVPSLHAVAINLVSEPFYTPSVKLFLDHLKYPKKPKMSFGSSVMSMVKSSVTTSDREELLGKQLETRASSYVGERITNTDLSMFAHLKEHLNERGEKLSEMEDQAETLRHEAENFGNLAAELRKQMERRAKNPWIFW